MRTIRHVTYGSAIKVGLVITALTYAIFGFFIFIVFLLSASAAGTIAGAYGVDTGAAAALGAVGGLLIWVFLIIAGAIGGAISGLIGAFFYNITASMVGGLEIDLGE